MNSGLKIDMDADNKIPSEMDKAKAAAVSFEKQVEDVNKKFSTFGKDLFLSFAAPMVLLQSIFSAVSQSIEKARQLAESGFKTLAAGEDEHASIREARMARFMQMQDESNRKSEESQAGRKASTEKFFEDRGFWSSFFERPVSTFAIIAGELGIGKGAGMDWIQEQALKDFEDKLTPEQKKAFNEEMALKNAPTGFKGPEGFSTIVGVGANPVLDAMTQQLEELRTQTELLAILAAEKPGDTDFTKNEYSDYQPYGM